MDRELSKEYVSRVNRKKIVLWTVGIAILIAFGWSIRLFLSPNLDSRNIRFAIAEVGDVESTLNASGIVLPEKEQVITSPINTKIIDVNFELGEHIKTGSKLLELDRESISNQYKQLVDEVEVQKNQIEKHELSSEKSIEESIANLDIKKLRVSFLESSLKREQKLLEIGASTEVKVEQSKLTLEIARRELLLLEKQIENEKKNIAAQLKDYRLQLRIQERRLDELKNKLEESSISSESGGVITWIKNEIGSNVREGDIIAKIANLNSFKVEANISDIYATQLRVSGRVRVRINNTDLYGGIKSISPSVENNLANFIIELDDNKNELLRPNLRVEVFVIISNVANVVRVKNGPFFNGSPDQKIYLVNDSKAIRADAVFGASNFDFVEIKSGIQAGDKIILSDMTEYYHMDEIEIN